MAEELQLFLKISGADRDATEAVTVPATATVDELKALAFNGLEENVIVRMVYQGHLLPGGAALARFAIPSGAFVHCFLARPAPGARAACPADDPGPQSWVTQGAIATSFVVLIAGGHMYLDHPEYFDAFAVCALAGLAVLWVLAAAGWALSAGKRALRGVLERPEPALEHAAGPSESDEDPPEE